MYAGATQISAAGQGSALPALGAVTLWCVGGHGEKAHRGFRNQAL
jgi:hypothetical protein